jgi:hypothetical protein
MTLLARADSTGWMTTLCKGRAQVRLPLQHSAVWPGRVIDKQGAERGQLHVVARAIDGSAVVWSSSSWTRVRYGRQAKLRKVAMVIECMDVLSSRVWMPRRQPFL